MSLLKVELMGFGTLAVLLFVLLTAPGGPEASELFRSPADLMGYPPGLPPR